MNASVSATSVSVERGGRRILDGASLDAAGGAFIGVIGPNGAGKSTLLRVLAGLEPPAQGHCTVNGQNIAALSPTARARALAFLPQARPVYWAMPVEAIVALGRFAYGAPARLEGENARAVAHAMTATGVAHLKDRAATSLSGGEAARVHLARALAAQTPILLADEPTAALDPRHQLAVMERLAGRAAAGGLVVAALHDLALAARFCTRIVLLEGGVKTADGPPDTALTADNLGRAFGVKARIEGAGRDMTISFSLA